MVCPQGNFQFSEHLSGLLDSSPEFLQWNEQQKQQLGSIKKYQHLTQHRGKEENVAITENSSKSSGMQQQEPSKSTWGEIPSVPGASRVKRMKSLQINKHFFIHQAGTSNFFLKAAEPLCFRKWGERGSRGSSIPLEQHWGILFLYMEKSFGAGLGDPLLPAHGKCWNSWRNPPGAAAFGTLSFLSKGNKWEPNGGKKDKGRNPESWEFWIFWHWPQRGTAFNLGP